MTVTPHPLPSPDATAAHDEPCGRRSCAGARAGTTSEPRRLAGWRAGEQMVAGVRIAPFGHGAHKDAVLYEVAGRDREVPPRPTRRAQGRPIRGYMRFVWRRKSARFTIHRCGGRTARRFLHETADTGAAGRSRSTRDSASAHAGSGSGRRWRPAAMRRWSCPPADRTGVSEECAVPGWHRAPPEGCRPAAAGLRCWGEMRREHVCGGPEAGSVSTEPHHVSLSGAPPRRVLPPRAHWHQADSMR